MRSLIAFGLGNVGGVLSRACSRGKPAADHMGAHDCALSARSGICAGHAAEVSGAAFAVDSCS